MNASDIQNALDRIIKQNRNLDESGLRVLLLASSWENEDIEKAVVIFKERKDYVLSSLSSTIKKDQETINETKKEESVVGVKIKEEDFTGHLIQEEDVIKVIDEIKSENDVVDKIIEKVEEKNTKEPIILEKTETIKQDKSEMVLPEQSKNASLGDLLSSSLKELDKVPEKVFEDKRSRGIDLESAPILVKNNGVSSVSDLKKEAIKEVLSGKKVSPVLKEEIKKEEVNLQKQNPIKVVESKKPEIKAEISTEAKKENNIKKEEIILIQSAEAPSDHLIPDEETMEKEEKTSLIKNEDIETKKTANKTKEEIPHNLPLKPFDASPHTVPFSEYKEKFHGKEEIENNTTSVLTNNIQPVYVIQNDNSHIIRSKKPTPLSKSEKELVIMASVLLFFILLLLSYMYSNGRI